MNKTLPLFALLLSASAHCQTLTEIEGLESRYEALTEELLALQGRMLQELDPRRTLPAQGRAEIDYKALTSCGDVLGSASQRLTALRQVVNISQFVWDSTAQSLARPYIELQVQALTKHLNRSSTYLDQISEAPHSRQVIVMCGRIHGLVRESIPVVDRVRPAWAPKQ